MLKKQEGANQSKTKKNTGTAKMQENKKKNRKTKGYKTKTPWTP